MNGILFPVFAFALGAAPDAAASLQQGQHDPAPVIDSIIIVTQNVFGPAEARGNFLFRVANALHVTTRRSVVRHELLFHTGEPYDSARVAETQRNLRRRGLFRDVSVDTVRVGDRVNVFVRTADGWTTELILNGRVTAGTFTWTAGVEERNFLGTGGRVGVVYSKEPDYTAFTFSGGLDRIQGSRLRVSGFFQDQSDGGLGGWTIGFPFRAFSDRRSLVLSGQAALDTVLQFRNGQLSQRFWRRLFQQNVEAAFAPHAAPGGYLRLGVAAQIKREEFIPGGIPVAVPDTVTAAVGAFAQLVAARFKVVTHYNGFAREEDLDLSTQVTLGAWLAPDAFGYRATGVGPGMALQTGVTFGKNFARLGVTANGLFTSAGLDSGQVRAAITVASQVIPKNATVFHLEFGVRSGTPPGFEFDLGDGPGPRAFGPHAFTGNRSIWGTLEQRAFLIDEVLNLFGIGFTAFLDYGGAWFDDQSARFGGAVGVGLAIGATRGTAQSVGKFDLAYRFGDGFTGGHLAVSLGRGFVF